MRLDVFGCVQMHLDAFGCFGTLSEIFGFLGFVGTILMIFGGFDLGRLFLLIFYDSGISYSGTDLGLAYTNPPAIPPRKGTPLGG